MVNTTAFLDPNLVGSDPYFNHLASLRPIPVRITEALVSGAALFYAHTRGSITRFANPAPGAARNRT